MQYRVKLDIFEGPLELLLFLVRKNEIEISEIPIKKLCDQFIEFLDLMTTLNLDLAGEFLVLAATLAYLKSKSLLPVKEDGNNVEDNLRFDLTQHLLEYKKFKEAANSLVKQNILEKDEFIRTYVCEEEVLKNGEESPFEVNLYELIDALRGVIKRIEENKSVMEVSKEKISLTEKLTEILEILKRLKSVSFSSLFDDLTRKEEVIVTFLAILELLRQQKIMALQNIPFGPISIVLRTEQNLL